MSKAPPEQQQWDVIKNTRSLITNADIAEWFIQKLKNKKYSPEIIGNYEVIRTTFETNQKNFEKDIEKGKVSKLPPSDPYDASKFVFEKGITEPMGDINFCLVFEDELLKGYRISIDGIQLEAWCESENLDPQAYLLILQIYFEDMIEDMGYMMVNGQFIQRSDGEKIAPEIVYEKILKNKEQHLKLVSELQSKKLLGENKQLSFAKMDISAEPQQKPSQQPSAGPQGA